MMNPGDFKKLLEYIIKYNINNSNKDKENKIIFLFSYYYLLIKNIKLISSLYFFYEQFILFAFTSLKYNILINNKYLARFNNYFIKNFKEKINCDKLLNEWCDINNPPGNTSSNMSAIFSTSPPTPNDILYFFTTGY